MKKKGQKERVVAYLYPEQISKMETLMHGGDMKNHTEFIGQAIDFYIGYLNTKDSTSFLSEHLLGAITATLKNTENRIANNIFRLTVEFSIMANALAEGMDGISDDWLRKTRARCIAEIKRSRGKISFDEIVDNNQYNDE